MTRPEAAGPTAGADEIAGGGDDAAHRLPGRGWWAGRPARVGAVLVGLVVLGVWRPDLGLDLSSSARPAPSGAPSAPVSSAAQTPASAAARDRGAGQLVPPAGGRAVTWDTRGDLAGDYFFVTEGVRELRVRGQRVARTFFAGRLPDGSRLLITGREVYTTRTEIDFTSVHALHIAPGTELGSAALTELGGITGDGRPILWAGRVGAGPVTVVVLGRPGRALSLEVSPRVRYGAAGEPSRDWTRHESGDGAMVVPVGSRTDPVVAVRADLAGSGQRLTTTVTVGPSGAAAPSQVEGVTDPGYRGPRRRVLGPQLVAAASGLADLSRSRAQVLWSGAPWAQRRLALVLVTRPDGQRLQVLVGGDPIAPVEGGVRALPRGAPDDEPFLFEPLSPTDPTFLLCPGGATTLLIARPGRRVNELRVGVDRAVALFQPGPRVPSARGAEVTLLAAGGRRILRTTLPTYGLDDPLVLGR